MAKSLTDKQKTLLRKLAQGEHKKRVGHRSSVSSLLSRARIKLGFNTNEQMFYNLGKNGII